MPAVRAATRSKAKAKTRRAGGRAGALEAENRISLAAKPAPSLVDVPEGRFLTVEGTGKPAGDAFVRAVGALYGVAWTVKMTGKKLDPARDFKVGALEGLWWGLAPGAPPARPEDWRWKLLMRVPRFVSAADVTRARAALAARGKDGAGVTLETFDEGRVVQALHVGPYADEPATIARMEAFVAGHGLAFSGDAHHEIYLSDPRRTAPSRLRTIVRHPVRRARAAT